MIQPDSAAPDRERLEEILAGKEYRAYEQGDGGSFLLDGLKPVVRWLRKHFPDVTLPQGTASFLNDILLVLLVALAGYAVYWFSRQLVRKGAWPGYSYFPADGEDRSYRHYWKLAEEKERAGEWREGVRAFYLALLFYLNEKELIRVEKWKTNWDYAGELEETAPSLSPLYRDCSRLFERVWYGREEAGPDSCASIREWAEQAVGRKEDAYAKVP
ncbi:DUF4129 domain-containing protein [Paenibacillus sp. CC-CFT747]|nr:DUF4129 domain-containing protein [Paenibacillus sp. CC-CFT747]